MRDRPLVREPVQHREGLVVGLVQVLEDEQPRLVVAALADEVCCKLLGAGCDGRWQPSAPGRLGRVLGVVPGRSDQGGELVLDRVGVRRETHRTGVVRAAVGRQHRVGEQPERSSPAGSGHREADVEPEQLRAGTHRVHQGGLADARLALEQDDRTGARRDGRERVVKIVELGGATDQRKFAVRPRGVVHAPDRRSERPAAPQPTYSQCHGSGLLPPRWAHAGHVQP